MTNWVHSKNGAPGHYVESLADERHEMIEEAANDVGEGALLSRVPYLVELGHAAIEALTMQDAEVYFTTQPNPK